MTSSRRIVGSAAGGAPITSPGRRARSGHPRAPFKCLLARQAYQVGPRRMVPTQSRVPVRKPARPCVCTHVRAVPRDFIPLRNKSSEENLPEGINVGVGRLTPLLRPFAIPERGLSCTPAALVTPCTPKGSPRLDLLG